MDENERQSEKIWNSSFRTQQPSSFDYDYIYIYILTYALFISVNERWYFNN